MKIIDFLYKRNAEQVFVIACVIWYVLSSFLKHFIAISDSTDVLLLIAINFFMILLYWHSIKVKRVISS